MAVRLIAILMLVSFPWVGAAQTQKSAAGVAPIAVLGEVSTTQRQIVFNRLLEELSTHYDLIPQDQFQQAQEEAFATLDAQECTEENCIRKIQELLQIENLFVFQMVRDAQDTQLSLTLITLDKKSVRNSYCENCNTRELHQQIAQLVTEFTQDISLPVSQVIPTPSPEEQQEELLKKIQQALQQHHEQNPETGILVAQYLKQFGTQSLRDRLQLPPGENTTLGTIFRKGVGVSTNNEEAVYWYQQAARQGDVSAQTKLGYLYRHGLGIGQDAAQAVFWYRQAAEQGYALAQFNLGSMYRKGYGVPQNIQKAKDLYQSAARQGSKEATQVLEWLNRNE